MTEENSEMIDPVALLGSLAPPVGWNERTATTGPNADRHATRLLDRVRTDAVTSKRPRRNGLRLVTSLVVALSLGGAVAAAVLWERSPDQITTLACWSSPSNPPAAQVGVEWDGVSPPAERCAPAWNDGDLGRSGPPAALQACVTEGGITAIVPGDEATCSTLGLARFVDPSRAPDATARFTVAELEGRLVDRFNTGQCSTPERARQDASELIDELDLDGWTVTVFTTFSAEEPCATVAVDSTSRTVFIVPDVEPTG